MKKIKLDELEFRSHELLTKSQMAKISGGQTATCRCENPNTGETSEEHSFEGDTESAAIFMAQNVCRGGQITHCISA